MKKPSLPVIEPHDCPVCNRPCRVSNNDGEWVVTAKCCSLWDHLKGIRFDKNDKKSSRHRHEFLKRFHCEMCPKCHLPKDECRKRLVRRAVNEVLPDGALGRVGTEEVVIAEKVKERECWRRRSFAKTAET